MLENITETKTNQNKKQIAIPNMAAANTVMYTVPARKEFRGRITSMNISYCPLINGVKIECFKGKGTSVVGAFARQDITLLAGTVVTESASANMTIIVGIEYDA